MRVPKRGESRNTRGCRTWGELKHTRVPNRFVSVGTRCRMKAPGKGHIDYIYTVGVSAKIHGHTQDCHSGLTPDARTQPTPVTRPALAT